MVFLRRLLAYKRRDQMLVPRSLISKNPGVIENAIKRRLSASRKLLRDGGSISLTVNCEAEFLSIHFEYADMESFNVPFRRSQCDLGATLDNLEISLRNFQFIASSHQES